MNDHERRLNAIELTLTPRQVVAAWLKNAIDAGTFEDGARRTPPARTVVANAVRNAVRNSMKGQAEPMIDRAVLQGRREADLNYNLVINVNAEVITSWEQRRREFTFLLGYLSAEMRAQATKERVQTFHQAVLMFLESVITLDAAISQVAQERLDGHPMLFRDSSLGLEEQLQMADFLSKHFNCLARAVDGVEIDLAQFRAALRSEADRRISIWVNRARLEMLCAFGKEEEICAVWDPAFASLRAKIR